MTRRCECSRRLLGALAGVALLCVPSTAPADEPAEETSEEATPAEEAPAPPARPEKPTQEEWAAMTPEEQKAWKKAYRETAPFKHAGFGVPIVSFNANDGLLLGLAAQYSFRPREVPYGYKFKVTLSGLVNLVPSVLNIITLVEYRGETQWTGKLRFRAQGNYPYSGPGGWSAIIKSESEADNGVVELGYSIAASRHIGASETLSWYAGNSFSIVGSHPVEDGNLDQLRPFASFGGLYFDFSGGVVYEEVDRWPRPIEGWYGEAGLRAGPSISRESPNRSDPVTSSAVGGVFLEGMRWQPVYQDWIVTGFRLTIDRTIGQRPFYDQNRVGGVFRDELGVDQLITGYGVYRFGGDGVGAAMIEPRFKIWHFDYPRFNLLLHASAFGEWAYVMDKWEMGPPLPTVGVSLDVIFAGMVYLRPFLAWGWTATEEDPTRRPTALFGLASRGTL